jgi:hypothetical protein
MAADADGNPIWPHALKGGITDEPACSRSWSSARSKPGSTIESKRTVIAPSSMLRGPPPR